LIGALGSLGVGFALYYSSDLSFALSLLVGVNAIALFLMGLDKSLSRSESLRVPEVIFFVLALCGAVPGILLGVHVFRHKTRKAGYQFVLFLIATAQVFLLRLFDINLR
jgi:uncharacterized membrane protein YsdA (DUF1294 family)